MKTQLLADQKISYETGVEGNTITATIIVIKEQIWRGISDVESRVASLLMAADLQSFDGRRSKETDGPYMCPEPFRGQTAHPGHVHRVADAGLACQPCPNSSKIIQDPDFNIFPQETTMKESSIVHCPVRSTQSEYHINRIALRQEMRIFVHK